MTQLDKDEPLDSAVLVYIPIPRDVLSAAIIEALERRPELLAAAIEKRQPPEPAPALPDPPPLWPNDIAAFGCLLRERRAAASLSREQLSKRSGVASSTIRNTECNRHRPTFNTRRLLIQALVPPVE